MAGSNGFPNIFSHRLSFHYPRRRKSVGNPLDISSPSSPVDNSLNHNQLWRESTPDLNRLAFETQKIQPAGRRSIDIMDAALKARNMRSASARRKRISDREESLRRENEAEQKRRRQIVFGYDSDEEQDSESDENTYSPIDDRSGEEAERSLSSYLDTKMQDSNIPSPQSEMRRLSAQIPPLKIDPQGMTVVDDMNDTDPRRQLTSSLPKREATVRVLEPELLNSYYPSPAPTVEDDSDVDFDMNEPYEPIEIATPVVVQLPRRRPTLVSIETSFSANSSAPSPGETDSTPLEPYRKAPRPAPSMASVRSGFAAGEAVPFEIPLLPSPPNKVDGSDTNKSSTESTTESRPQILKLSKPPSSPRSPKRLSLISRSKSWREHHKARRQQSLRDEAPQTPTLPIRPRTSSAAAAAAKVSMPLPPSPQAISPEDYEDWDFGIPAGFPLPPVNIPTPMASFNEEMPNTLGLGLLTPSSQRSSDIPLSTTPHTQIQPALPPTPLSLTSSHSPFSITSRTDSPSPHPASAISIGSSTSKVPTGPLPRKKSLTGLRTRSGSMGKALASKGAKISRQVSESVKRANAPPMPPPVQGPSARDFASPSPRWA